MRLLTRLLGETLSSWWNDESKARRCYSPHRVSLPGCAVLLSSSQSDEEVGRVDDNKDVVGLIRPVKDLSIWLAEDQVGIPFKTP